MSFAWQPEPNYSNGIANARRDGDYIYVYVYSSVSKAWTSRYSTTLGANFSMINYCLLYTSRSLVTRRCRIY